MQVSIAFAEKHTDGYPWKIDGTVRQEVFSLRGGLWFGTLSSTELSGELQ